MRQAGEPTVEEILESIKQVIARDNRAGAAIERRRRATQGVAAEVEAETEDSEDVLELAETAAIDPAEAAAEPALINAAAQANMRESLAALAMLSGPGAAPRIVRSGETSLEGMVRDLLRPALAEWLDRNLPPMVEKLVAAEIARIVGKKA